MFPERAFSAVGLFTTKLRGKMSDRRLEELLILRSHFLREAEIKNKWKDAERKRCEDARKAQFMDIDPK